MENTKKNSGISAWYKRIALITILALLFTLVPAIPQMSGIIGNDNNIVYGAAAYETVQVSPAQATKSKRAKIAGKYFWVSRADSYLKIYCSSTKTGTGKLLFSGKKSRYCGPENAMGGETFSFITNGSTVYFAVRDKSAKNVKLYSSTTSGKNKKNFTSIKSFNEFEGYYNSKIFYLDSYDNLKSYNLKTKKIVTEYKNFGEATDTLKNDKYTLFSVGYPIMMGQGYSVRYYNCKTGKKGTFASSVNWWKGSDINKPIYYTTIERVDNNKENYYEDYCCKLYSHTFGNNDKKLIKNFGSYAVGSWYTDKPDLIYFHTTIQEGNDRISTEYTLDTITGEFKEVSREVEKDAYLPEEDDFDESSIEWTDGVTGGAVYFDKATGEITACDEEVTAADIPDEIQGVKVTGIGEYAFEACSSLTSITIPNSVTGIGEGAFSGCSSLTDVIIPNSVVSIGDEAFAYCSSLTSITIPNSVSYIGDWAFDCCEDLAIYGYPGSYAETYAEEEDISFYSIVE